MRDDAHRPPTGGGSSSSPLSRLAPALAAAAAKLQVVRVGSGHVGGGALRCGNLRLAVSKHCDHLIVCHALVPPLVVSNARAAREAQRVAARQKGRVGVTLDDLVSGDRHHLRLCWLKPDVGLVVRLVRHPPAQVRRPLVLVPLVLPRPQLLAQLEQPVDRVARTHLAKRVEARVLGLAVLVLFVGGRLHAQQEVRDGAAPPLPLAIVPGDDEQVELVAHVVHVVGLELHPVVVARAGHVGRIRRLEHDALVPQRHRPVEAEHDLHCVGGRFGRVRTDDGLLRELHRVGLPIDVPLDQCAPLAQRKLVDGLAVEPEAVEYHVARLLASLEALLVVAEAAVLPKGRVLLGLEVPDHHLAVEDALVQLGPQAPPQHRRHRIAIVAREVLAVASEPLGPIGCAADAAPEVEREALAVELVLGDVLAALAHQLVQRVPVRAHRQPRLHRLEQLNRDVVEAVARIDALFARRPQITDGVVELLGVGVEELEDPVLLHPNLHVLQDHPQDPPLLARRRPVVQAAHHLALRIDALRLGQLVEQRIELADGELVLDVGTLARAVLEHRVHHLGEVALLVALEAARGLLPVEQRLRVLR